MSKSNQKSENAKANHLIDKAKKDFAQQGKDFTNDIKQHGEEFAEKSAVYSKAAVEKTEAVAEATGESLQQSYSAAVSETSHFNMQWLEMMRDNANASLDLASKMLTAKSPTEAFELMAAHTRRQFETFAQQAQALTGLAQKATTESIKPLQAGAKTAFDKAA
jgi:phasin